MRPGRIPTPLSIWRVLLVFAVIPGVAAAAPIAVLGDPAPGTGGGHFTFLAGAQLSETGEVAFYGSVAAGVVGSGVFVGDGNATRAVALDGMTAPGTGGGTLASFDPSSIRVNGAGDVAFAADVANGTTLGGLFVEEPGGLSAIALLGDPAPGTSGSYAGFGLFDLNGAGEAAFRGSTSGVTPTVGVFVESTSSSRIIAKAGDQAPGVPGATFDFFGHPAINDAGEVAFSADFSGPGYVGNGVWRFSGGVGTLVAVEDGRAAGTAGGEFDFFDFTAPGLDANGAVYFRAGVVGSGVTEGAFEGDGADLVAVVLPGDPMPATGRALVDTLLGGPTASADGSVAYAARLTGGTASSGLFVQLTGGRGVAPVAVSGAPASGTGGGTYDQFSPEPVPNESGSVAFSASIAGGETSFGVFVPEPGTTPALVAGSLALLGRKWRIGLHGKRPVRAHRA